MDLSLLRLKMLHLTFQVGGLLCLEMLYLTFQVGGLLCFKMLHLTFQVGGLLCLKMLHLTFQVVHMEVNGYEFTLDCIALVRGPRLSLFW